MTAQTLKYEVGLVMDDSGLSTTAVVKPSSSLQKLWHALTPCFSDAEMNHEMH